MALDLAAMGSATRKAEPQTLAPVPFEGPPPPPPIPPTPGMYPPGPPPPGVLLPRPIVYPLDPVAMAHMDECRSRSLIKFISGAGVVPSPEDERRRERVVRELGKIVMDWAKRVAYQQGEQYWITTATVLTYGSYDLGLKLKLSPRWTPMQSLIAWIRQCVTLMVMSKLLLGDGGYACPFVSFMALFIQQILMCDCLSVQM